jgi:hypothetical protein
MVDWVLFPERSLYVPSIAHCVCDMGATYSLFGYVGESERKALWLIGYYSLHVPYERSLNVRCTFLEYSLNVP